MATGAGDTAEDGTEAGGTEAGGPARLLERERELAALRAAVDSAAGRSGTVLVVQGPPGAGKTVLLAAAEAYGRAAGLLVLSSRGRELERAVALGVAADLLTPPLLAAGPAERARLLAGLATPAGPVLLGPGGPPYASADATAAGLCWLAVNLTRTAPAGRGTRPVLITVDDAQWADGVSQRFLAMLADRADRLSLSLVVAVRDDEAAGAGPGLRRLATHPRARVLVPPPLTAGAVGRLAAALVPGAEPGLAEAVRRVSGGSPFFATELLRSLQSGTGPPAAATVARMVPATVLRSVLARLARLPAAAGQLAASLAVLGDETPLRRAADHAGLTLAAAGQAADQLTGARLVRARRPLAFAHPLIGTAVHDGLPLYARARAHRRAAGLLAADGAGPEKVASHLLRAEPEGDPGTAAVLCEAARRAMLRGDPAAATRLLRRALAEPPPAAQRAGLLIELAQAQMTAGDVTAHASLNEGISLLGPAQVHARAAALATASRIHHARGDLSQAAAASTAALGLLDPRDPAWQDALADLLAVAAFHPPLLAEAEQWLVPVLHATRQGRPPQGARLLAHVIMRLALAGEAPALVHDLGARALAQDPMVFPADHGELFGIVTHSLVLAGHLAVAEEAAGAALTASRERGNLLGYAAAGFHRALSRFHQGALTAALADLEAARTSVAAGWHGAIGWIYALTAQVQLDRGDHPAAREALRRAGPRPAESMDAALLGLVRARLALAEHDPATALDQATAAGRHLRQTYRVDHPGLLPWRATAALAAYHLGDYGLARQLAGEALDRARQIGVAAAQGAALRLTGLVARPGDGPAILAEAAAVLRDTPAGLEHARALVDLGAALRRAGQREASRRPLREGLALAGRLQAGPLADRASAELRAAGSRPRRTAMTGIDALTPAEQRVALLALHGDSNTTIAQMLFVTTKTVETHLARAYRKLGISNRRQLSDAFGPARR
jgi:DNA-binding CsgD family transcriptional regulator